ncbi:MAG: L,D-transpeptidase family protein [Methylophilaceae bacterium]|nr:L,D-transpeptidase family protein [Methylophilaceae bacterium]
MRFIIICIGCGLVVSPFLSWNVAATVNPTVNSTSRHLQINQHDIESLLIKGLLETSQGQLQQALATTDELLRVAPNFKLAHLVRGDLFMARAQQLQTFGNSTANPAANVEDFRQEALVRLQNYLGREQPKGKPEFLWEMNSAQAYAVVIDAEKSRLYIYHNENGKPRYVADYYVTLGKNGVQKKAEGDKRTPVGVYFSSAQLKAKLPDFYGAAAFPLNYPNEWDNRQGNGGHGIWIHGTPSDSYSRPPRASNGCVVVAAPDLKALMPFLQNGNTPVIIAEQIQWLTEDQSIPQKAALSAAIENWRHDWETQNTEQYLAHYSSNFFNSSYDFSSWIEYKRRVQTSASGASIKLSNFSMFRYPDAAKPMVVVSFEQDFKNNQLENRMQKRQYWVLENQQWKILYEDAA